MKQGRRGGWRRRVSVLALAALPAAPAVAGSSGAGSPAKGAMVRATVDVPTRFLLGQALSGASLRLGQLACQAVLTDFRDSAGRTLDRALGETGFTAQEYFGLLFFADGAGYPRCRKGAGAFTVPGSRVVHVCPATLRREFQRGPALAEAILIHEMLHSLGLPENPPSAAEISARVASRCLSSR